MQGTSTKFLLKSSTKTAIIDLLSGTYPLTTKSIFTKLSHEFNHLSYQGVHKSLKELTEEKVVVKEEEGYSLDPVWVEGLKSFALDLNENYKNKQKVDWSEDLISLHFPTLLSMMKFIIGTYESRFPNPEKKDSICLWKHPWPIVGFGEKEVGEVKKLLKETQHYAISPNAHPLDKFFSGMVEGLGKKSKLGIASELDCDMKIRGDYIAQIYIPKELKDELDSIYTTVTTLENFDYTTLLTRVVEQKTDILIVIQKNQTMAEHFRKMVKEKFNA